ncbi:hypothetical protein [Rhodococcus aetherivorans]
MPPEVHRVGPIRARRKNQPVRQRRLAEGTTQWFVTRQCAFQVVCVRDREVLGHGEEARVECDIVCGACRQSVQVVEAFLAGAVSPRLDVARREQSRPATSSDYVPHAAEHAPVAVVGQHCLGESVPTDTNGRGEQTLRDLDRHILPLTRPLLDNPLEFSLDGGRL